MTRSLTSSVVLALRAATLGAGDVTVYGAYTSLGQRPAYPLGYAAPVVRSGPHAAPEKLAIVVERT
jgi:hypothetical protein